MDIPLVLLRLRHHGRLGGVAAYWARIVAALLLHGMLSIGGDMAH
jgi:hypothetical protein